MTHRTQTHRHTDAQPPVSSRTPTRTRTPAPTRTPPPAPPPSRPRWGVGADGRDPATDNKAARSDREHRAAWGQPRLPSPYLHIVALPPRVAPADHATALAILDRVEECLAKSGRYTPAERRRLNGMASSWRRRASGTDVMFNLEGWTRAGPDYSRRGAWEQRQRDLKFAAIIDDLRSTTTPGSGSGE